MSDPLQLGLETAIAVLNRIGLDTRSISAIPRQILWTSPVSLAGIYVDHPVQPFETSTARMDDFVGRTWPSPEAYVLASRTGIECGAFRLEEFGC